MVGSGSEPTYLPLTNTSCAELVLYFLGAANAPEAVPMTRAIASADLVNMIISCGVVGYTSFGVRGHLALMSERGKSAPGPAASRLAQRVCVRDKLDNKGLLQRPAAGRGGSIGPGNEVSKLVWPAHCALPLAFPCESGNSDAASKSENVPRFSFLIINEQHWCRRQAQ